MTAISAPTTRKRPKTVPAPTATADAANGNPRLARRLWRISVTGAIFTAAAALVIGGMSTSLPDIVRQVAIGVVLIAFAVTMAAFIGWDRVRPMPTRQERINQARYTIAELTRLVEGLEAGQDDDALAEAQMLLRSKTAYTLAQLRHIADNSNDPAVRAEATLLLTGILSNPADLGALAQAERSVRRSGKPGGPLAITPQPKN